MKAIDKKIGIIGGGQLGKMMILEAKRLGFYVVTLDPDPDCSAHSVSDEHMVASFFDEAAFNELSNKVDVITYDLEGIDAEALSKLERGGKPVYPSAESLKLIQDKFVQKTTLQNKGILVPKLEAINTLDDLRNYAARNGYPICLKTCKGGYDGKGVYAIKTEADLENGFNTLGAGQKPLMVEEFINFKIEVSVVATRGIDGSKVVYPVVDNTHVNNICDVSIVPVNLPANVIDTIKQTAEKVMDIFAGVGTFAVEMFIGQNNEVYVNEVAPRPHNSGHYTIEGCRVNQFENHVRAVVGLPLGDTSLLHGAVLMRNLLGQSDGRATVEGLEEAYKLPGVNVHIYGKPVSKKLRKMGHYTVTAATLDEAKAIDKQVMELVKIIGV